MKRKKICHLTRFISEINNMANDRLRKIEQNVFAKCGIPVLVGYIFPPL
jgi:hypothetical protein